MDKKKVLVDIYLAKNLGDDMFLDHLAKKLPYYDFVPFYPGLSYKSFFSKYKNIKQFSYNLLDKIFARFGSNKLTNYEKLSEEFNGLIFLGGGIFREEIYWKDVFNYRLKVVNAFRTSGKNVFFSGCNFGPYSTVQFTNAHRSLFNAATQTIFRDMKSYDLFSDLQNVAYAPDVLWSYDLPTINKIGKTLGISVIDPNHKAGSEGTYDDYIESHKLLCSKYLAEGYKIILFSFCEKEGDLAVAKEIAANFPQIVIQNYEGDISSYLKEIGKCTFFVASRFHAVIIAFKFGIPVIPVIYGDKTQNLLVDLKFKEPFVNLTTINTLQKTVFLMISDVQKEKLYEASKKHFEIHFP